MMNTIKQVNTLSICYNMTQIEIDLEVTLNKILIQAGNKIKLENQEKYKQEIAKIKEIFAKFKTQLGCLLNSESD